MSKVLIFYQPGNEHHPNWTFCLPGEDEDAEFRLARETYEAEGHVCLIVDHDGPAHAMHHGHAVGYVAQHKG